jgi:hypothetical protein
MKIKTIIAILAFGASALAANASFVQEKIDASGGMGGWGAKEGPPSSLSPQAAGPNQDSGIESISAVPELMTISTVPKFMSISAAPRLVTISTEPKFMTIFEAPELITMPAVPLLTTSFAVPKDSKISALSESASSSGLAEGTAVSDVQGLMALSAASAHSTTSKMQELEAISGVTGGTVISDTVETGIIPVVPEPSTILAGALLLLPLGVSTVRILRLHIKR